MDMRHFCEQALQSGKIGEIRAIRILFRQYVRDIFEPRSPIYQLNHSLRVGHGETTIRLDPLLTCRRIFESDRFEYEPPENVLLLSFKRLLPAYRDTAFSDVDGDWCPDHPRRHVVRVGKFIGSDARMFCRENKISENRNRYHPSFRLKVPMA